MIGDTKGHKHGRGVIESDRGDMNVTRWVGVWWTQGVKKMGDRIEFLSEVDENTADRGMIFKKRKEQSRGV